MGDDPWCSRILGKCTCPVITTSVKSPAGLWAENLELLPDGVTFTARYGQQSVPVRVPIPGKFTVYNALTVLGCALSLGISLEAAAGALATAPGVKGRVEVVPTPGKPYTVLIDYAHTPDGLENVLQSVKGFCKGRVIVVFGCGGDRDPMKRPIMGKNRHGAGRHCGDYLRQSPDGGAHGHHPGYSCRGRFWEKEL